MKPLVIQTFLQRTLHGLLLSLLLLGAAPMPWAQSNPGSFDTSFFGTGKRTDLSISSGNDEVRAVAVQPDGLILLAGTCTLPPSNDDFCLARLQPNGSLDLTFNGPPGSSPGSGRFTLPIGANEDRAHAMALQPDGKIVVAGECRDGTAMSFCYARLLPNGDLDSGFGFGGKDLLTMGSGGDARITQVLLQPDQKLVLVGTCFNPALQVCIARLRPDGSLDPTFGTSGRAYTFSGDALSSSDRVRAALQPNGAIVVTTSCFGGGTWDFCLARLTSGGSPDSTLTAPAGGIALGTGRFRVPIGTSTDSPNAVTVQPDGRILVAGTCQVGGNSQFCLARFEQDGAWDPLFLGPGWGAGRFVLTLTVGSNNRLNAMKLLPDGRILLAGECLSSGFKFCLARLQGNGDWDRSFFGPGPFPSGGEFILPMVSATSLAFDLDLQSDGRIIVGGSCTNTNFDFCVARLHGGPLGARHCTLDLDGDNQVLASKDLLMASRVALGVTGAAVLNGVSFAPHAQRTTWSAIRNYLVAQCGMSIP